MSAETLQGRDTSTYRPDWLRKPSGKDIAWAYPKRAAREGMGGKAVLKCLVAPDGAVTQCQVVSEAPADEGFGAAALGIAPQFQMTRPPSEAKNPSDVTIPIVFSTRKVPDRPDLPATLKPLAGVFSREKIRDARGNAVAPSPLETVLFGATILMVLMTGVIVRKRAGSDGKDLSGPNSERR